MSSVEIINVMLVPSSKVSSSLGRRNPGGQTWSGIASGEGEAEYP